MYSILSSANQLHLRKGAAVQRRLHWTPDMHDYDPRYNVIHAEFKWESWLQILGSLECWHLRRIFRGYNTCVFASTPNQIERQRVWLFHLGACCKECLVSTLDSTLEKGPWLIQISSGTMSSKEVIWNLNENGLVTKECAGPPTSIGNYCVSKQRDPGGKPDGRTVWVKTDCVTNLPLPKNQQNPIYQQKGVAMHRGGQMARALSDGAKQQHGGSSNGLYIHLQGKKDCSTGSKVLVTCFGWPKDTCCKSGLARKNAAFFGGKTALDHQYTNYISDNPTGVPSQYCTTIKGTGRTQTAGQGVCVSGAKGTGGASWSPILGCPTLSACSGPPGRRSLEPDTNGTMSANGQTEPTCKESVFGDHLAFPKEGGVLVIPGWRAEDLEDTLAALPDDDETLVEKYRELGAKHYPRVSDYSETLNEDGTSKSDVGE